MDARGKSGTIELLAEVAESQVLNSGNLMLFGNTTSPPASAMHDKTLHRETVAESMTS